MPRSASTTKTRILSAAYELFYKEGFARVSMDAIAEAGGVTKRTLYYHFDSKDALAAAMLDHQHFHALTLIQRWGKSSAETPADYLNALFEQLGNWASKPRWHGSGFTRLTMELADLPGHPVRHAAHQHKSAVEDWLAGEMKRLGAGHPKQLARQTMLLIEGCFSLILIHGDTTYVSAAAEAATQLANRRTT
jgi:AcrR family transcriptional regulator